MSIDRDDYDALVVGARVAGASTAMLLARAGLSVLLVDRTSYGSDTLSTHALMRGGVVQLARWGLLDRIVGAGTPPVRHAVFRYTNEVVDVPIKPSHGIDALYAPRRTVLDPILVNAAFEAGVEVRFGHVVTGLRRDDRGRVVGADVVDTNDRAGRARTVRAGVVIGADGVRSTVAEAVGAHVEHRGSSSGAYVYGYWTGIATDSYEWAFRPTATAGFIPTNDGRTCVFAGSSPHRVGRGGRAVLEGLVREAAPDMGARLAAAGAPAGVRSFPGRPGHLRQAWGPGWALVGDAGSWKDPISAHGLTDALRDAELVARAVLATVSGDRREGEAFATYQATRDRLTLPMLTIADRIASHRWDESEIGPLLLGLNGAMAEELDVIAALDVPTPAGP